ncbi:MAG: VWA domain-containing protein, partial [Verrucomicrobiota bacterium]
MAFGAPQFLLLIPLFAVLGFVIRRLELWRPLRVLLLLLLVLALCDPRILRKSGGLDLWVLVDRSNSARDLVDRSLREWKTLLENSRPGEKDTLHWIDYAAEAMLAGSEGTEFAGNRDQSRTRLAIQDALARMDPRRHNRILLFTDGYSTEPLASIGDKLITAAVPLDYRQLRAGEEVDFQLAALDIPERVQLGEPFVVDIRITGNRPSTVPLSIYRGEQLIFTREVELVDKVAQFRFSDRLATPGAQVYRAVLEPEEDAYAGNNRHEKWIEVVAGPRILLLTRYQNDPVATSLRAQNFEVEVITETLSLNPGKLTGARAVIFNNVPAYELDNEFLGALKFFVNDQGGGLLMAGGRQSFGSGGYYESDLDELLPVTMELKSEHRKLAVAMAIVLDRSGSMSMTVPSGHSKMQLANEGSARAVELLGGLDAVTSFAVDTQAHQVNPLTNVGKNRAKILQRLRSVESMGGGIYVYTGLEAAWKELQKAEAGQRHIILFSDAQDSEEPGKYRELIEEMREAGATVSVIGLGTRSDVHASFLEDIAKRGDGRIFFTQVPNDIPNIFAQETVTVARSTFVEDPTPTQ